MVCTGTKSEQEARTASRKYAKILQKLGYAVSFKVGGTGRTRGAWDLLHGHVWLLALPPCLLHVL